MIAFIDVHRGAYGVEPICRTLQIAPSTYHEHAARRRDPACAPARQRRDNALKNHIRRIWDENFQVYVARLIDWAGVLGRSDPVGLTQGLDAVVNLLILAFGAIWFVLTLEQRLKRREVQRRLYELRAFAHVIDMHQLTKDPTVLLGAPEPTSSSPVRRMSEFQLSRYLDYCSEMLALIAKLAALYAGWTRDTQVVASVNEVEELTSDLGRKIWQKIMILNQLDERRPCP